MAAGDWAAGTKLQVLSTQPNFDSSTGAVGSIGIGYRIILPSGHVATSSGFSWAPPVAMAKVLATAVQALLGAVLQYEGVADIHVPPTPPPHVPPSF